MIPRSLSSALLSLLLFPILVACSLVTSAPPPSQTDIEREEQAVYSVFLAAHPDTTLLLENTDTGIYVDDASESETRSYVKAALPDVSRELLDHFMERNASKSQLAPDMQLGVEYVLLTEEDLAEISSQPNWHELIRERYGSVGYLIFSRVGFNNSLDEAIVYVGHVEGPLMGSGSLYRLEKVDGEWTIMDEVGVWIS